MSLLLAAVLAAQSAPSPAARDEIIADALYLYQRCILLEAARRAETPATPEEVVNQSIDACAPVHSRQVQRVFAVSPSAIMGFGATQDVQLFQLPERLRQHRADATKPFYRIMYGNCVVHYLMGKPEIPEEPSEEDLRVLRTLCEEDSETYRGWIAEGAAIRAGVNEEVAGALSIHGSDAFVRATLDLITRNHWADYRSAALQVRERHAAR